MAGEWREVALEELAKEITVGHVGPMASEYVEAGVPFLRSQNVEPLRINITDLKFISREFHKRLSKSKLSPGDVVIVRTGKPGACAVIPEWLQEANCSDLVIVRCGTGIDNRFLAYYVNSAASHHVASHLVGAVQQHFNVGSARTLRIALPPLTEQKAIAGVLGSLDDKIELNQRMNRTLEEMARAIFKSWFVNFDPVRAKAAVRREHPKWTDDQVSRAACPNLKSEIALLFPDSFEDSELGEIPKGWAVMALDGIARFLNGLALQKFPPEDGDSLPVIKIAQLRAGNTVGADRASARLNADYIVQDGDILFSWSGSLECVLWAGGPGALNQHLFKVTSSEYPKWLCYLAVHQHLDEFRHIAASKATTMGHIQRHHLAGAKIAVPVDENLLSAIDAVLDPMFESLWRREVLSRTLAAVRDTLLPKLISGELRVPDAERIAGRCV